MAKRLPTLMRGTAPLTALYAQNILNGLIKADPQDKAALEASGSAISAN
jgi:ABC-type Zn uptake system ZnuABC Zn-binding protein ZnuA